MDERQEKIKKQTDELHTIGTCNQVPVYPRKELIKILGESFRSLQYHGHWKYEFLEFSNLPNYMFLCEVEEK